MEDRDRVLLVDAAEDGFAEKDGAGRGARDSGGARDDERARHGGFRLQCSSQVYVATFYQKVDII